MKKGELTGDCPFFFPPPYIFHAKLKGNSTALKAPRPGWGRLPTVTAAAPEEEEKFSGAEVCNKRHTEAAAHV